MTRMSSSSYEKLRSLSRGNFSPPQFLQLKKLAANIVRVTNSIFAAKLNSLLTLCKPLAKEIEILEKENNRLIRVIYTLERQDVNYNNKKPR